MAMPGIIIKISADTADAIRGINKVEKSLGQSLGPAQKFGAVLNRVVGPALIGVGAAAGTMAIKWGIEGVGAAADLNEEISKASVIFGTVSGDVVAFSKTANTALGSTQQAALAASSQFAQFGKAAGLSGDDLVAFSTDLVTLGTDLASFNNTPVDQAITALGAALRGESEPMRKFGVLLDDATLKAKAMEMGIYDGSGALTSQQKTLAAYQVILAQTGDAQGDFARTSGNLRGQQKILEASVEDLKTAFGVGLLGALEDTDTGSADLITTLQELKPTIEAVGATVGETIVAVTELVKLVQDAVTWFNEWKKALGPFEAVIDSLTAALYNMATPLLKIAEAARAARDAISSLTGAQRAAGNGGGGGGGGSTFSLSRSAAPTYNVTVNGAVDPIGTARQIERLLRQGQLRTGAGM